MTRENVQVLISEAGRILGFDDLALDEEGCCVLQIDEKITLTIEYADETEDIRIYAQVGNYSPDNEQEIFKAILEANFLWTGTGGATLSINSKERSVYIAYQEKRREITPQLFLTLLEGFIENTEFWMHNLSHLQAKSEETLSTEEEVADMRLKV